MIKKYDIDQGLTHFMDVYERIYDNNSNHKLQCWSDIKPFHLCMELQDEDNNNMVVLTKQFDIINDPFIIFEFIHDEYWNEIIQHHNEEGQELSTEKCTRFYESKLCVIKTVDNIYKLKIIRHQDDDISSSPFQ